MHLTGTPGPCHQEKLFGAFQSPSPRPPTDTPSEQQPPCVWPPTHAPGELRARWPLPAEGRTPLCPDSQPQSRSRDQLRARHMGSSPTETRQGHPLRWEKPRALLDTEPPEAQLWTWGTPGPSAPACLLCTRSPCLCEHVVCMCLQAGLSARDPLIKHVSRLFFSNWKLSLII